MTPDLRAAIEQIESDLKDDDEWPTVRGKNLRTLLDAVKQRERDAARYRWLRRWWVECYPTDEQGDPIDGGKIALSSTADCLDELIDAAIDKERGNDRLHRAQGEAALSSRPLG